MGGSGNLSIKTQISREIGLDGDSTCSEDLILRRRCDWACGLQLGLKWLNGQEAMGWHHGSTTAQLFQVARIRTQ